MTISPSRESKRTKERMKRFPFQNPFLRRTSVSTYLSVFALRLCSLDIHCYLLLRRIIVFLFDLIGFEAQDDEPLLHREFYKMEYRTWAGVFPGTRTAECSGRDGIDMAFPNGVGYSIYQLLSTRLERRIR